MPTNKKPLPKRTSQASVLPIGALWSLIQQLTGATAAGVAATGAARGTTLPISMPSSREIKEAVQRRFTMATLPFAMAYMQLANGNETPADAAASTLPEQAAEASTAASAGQPENAPDENKDDKDKKPLPKKGKYRLEMEKMGNNIKNTYKNFGTTLSKGLGYTIGYSPLWGTLSYGAYNLIKPEETTPTRLDSILSRQNQQLMDLEQMKLINETLKKINELMRLYGTNRTETDSTYADGTHKPVPASSDPTSYTSAQIDSLFNKWATRK